MPQTKGQRTWHENHERLYEAALREIERVGFHEVRIGRICRETRLSRPTFYAHFSSKDSVVHELRCRFAAEIARGLEERTKRPHDLEDVIDELVRLFHYASSTTPRRLRRELVTCLPRHYDVGQLSTASVCTILGRAISRAAQQQDIGPVRDPRALARQLTVVVDGCFLAHPDEPDKAARESRELLGLMLKGLRRAGGRASIRAGEHALARAPYQRL
jgi:AcrR family transcriptional regulator